MDWQQVTALAIVGLTAMAFLGARWRGNKPFGRAKNSGCGCPGNGPALGSPQAIQFRARKGQRPEIRVKNTATRPLP